MSDEKRYRDLGCSQSYAEWLSQNSEKLDVKKIAEIEKIPLRKSKIILIVDWVLSWLQRKNS